MARIIYGVMGDAGGHINRSLAVAAEMREHEFLFVGGGRTIEARDHGHGYAPLPMLSTILKDNRVLPGRTAVHFLKTILGYGGIIDGLCRMIDGFKPNLAVTDYEFFLPRAAKRCGVPVVSLDHQHVLTHCSYAPPPGETLSRLVTIASVRHLFSRADRYVVSSFFSLPPVGDKTEVVPPILHRDVLAQTPQTGDFGVVYMRSGVDRDLMDGLRASARQWRVYGTGESGSVGNVRFMVASRDGFLADVASCAYVICNGGHTLTSEALQLGKPVLAFPTAFFYEQYFNAIHLRRLGYGDFAATKDAGRAINTFEDRLERFRATVAGVDLFGNRVAAETLLAKAGG